MDFKKFTFYLTLDYGLFKILHGFAAENGLIGALAVFFAEYLGWLLILSIAAFFLVKFENWRERFKLFSFLILSLILSRGILTEIIRFFYERPRPFLALGFEPLVTAVNHGSFPSGHASFYFALAFTVFAVNKKAGCWFLAGAFLVGVGRVLVGVHWPLDILGGFLVAGLSVFLVKKLVGVTNQ